MDATPEDPEAKRLELAVKAVMGTEQGRWVMGWILDMTGWRNSATHVDSLRMAIANGRRDIGVELANAIEEITPNNFDLMMKELRNGR